MEKLCKIHVEGICTFNPCGSPNLVAIIFLQLYYTVEPLLNATSLANSYKTWSISRLIDLDR